jgi:hypothetical protein
MRVVIVTILGAALASCDSMPQANARDDGPVAENGFPKPGEYHVVRDVNVGGVPTRYESDSHVDASSREQLVQLVGGSGDSPDCDDRRIDVGGGSFTVRQTCNGPLGETTIDTHGTYSKDSIDVTYDKIVAGTAYSDATSYRLRP